MNKKSSEDLPILSFQSSQELEDWFANDHKASSGIWLKLAKKSSGTPSVTHQEALGVALCYGWIDGQGKPFDEKFWLIKYTPRRPRSLWSKRNRELVEELTKAGKMKPAGLEEVKKAKADGRWAKAYDSPANMEVPEDFLIELANHKEAESFFKTLNRANRYSIAWRLQTAKKPETRKRRMEKMLDMMKHGERFN